MTLREWRESKGMSLRELAETFGMSVHTLSAYERGLRKPRSETAQKIERLTSGAVAASELLGLTPSRGVTEDTVPITGALEADPHPYRGDKGSLVLNLPLGLLEAAEEYGLDAAALVLEGGREKLEAEVRHEFRSRNAAALEWTRKYVEEHGTLSQQFGMI